MEHGTGTVQLYMNTVQLYCTWIQYHCTIIPGWMHNGMVITSMARFVAFQHGSKSGENYNSQVALNFEGLFFSFSPSLSHHAFLGWDFLFLFTQLHSWRCFFDVILFIFGVAAIFQFSGELNRLESSIKRLLMSLRVSVQRNLKQSITYPRSDLSIMISRRHVARCTFIFCKARISI